ncbi:MAG: hypothetical protein ACT4TC_10480 [Myxococcaceae bacterium]
MSADDSQELRRAARLIEAAKWLKREGDRIGAADLLEEALALDPTNSSAATLLGLMRSTFSPGPEMDETTDPFLLLAVPDNATSPADVHEYEALPELIEAREVEGLQVEEVEAEQIIDDLPMTALLAGNAPNVIVAPDIIPRLDVVSIPARPGQARLLRRESRKQQKLESVTRPRLVLIDLLGKGERGNHDEPPTDPHAPELRPEPLTEPELSAVLAEEVRALVDQHAEALRSQPRALAALIAWSGPVLEDRIYALEFLAGPLEGHLVTLSHQTATLVDTCVIEVDGETLRVGSEEIVYRALRDEQRVDSGARILAGQREFILERLSQEEAVAFGGAELVLHELNTRGTAEREIRLNGPIVSVGRDGCTFGLPQEDSMATRHFELTIGPWSAYLADCAEDGSGTYLALTSGSRTVLVDGDRIRGGAHLFRIVATLGPVR